MGWFDKQVRQIKQDDQKAFEESVFRMASVVLGKHDSGLAEDELTVTKAAIDEVLKYYHYKPVDIPNTVKDPEEQLEWSLRPYGIMHRRVEIKGKWYKDAIGPVLGFMKEGNRPVALIPKEFGGYWFYNPQTGEKETVNRHNAQLFELEAIYFYRPLPLKELGIPDLIRYMLECVYKSDIVTFVLLTLFASVVGMAMPRATKVLTGMVVDSKNMIFLTGTAIFMLSAAISSMLISAVKDLSFNSTRTKIDLSVQSAVFSRVLNLPAEFFRKYSSGELSTRTSSATNLCSILLDNIFSTGITAVFSLVYVTQIFAFAPSLVGPALLIILSTVVINIVAALMNMRYAKAAMESGATNSGLTYAIINGVQKIKLAGAEKRVFAKWANSYSKQAAFTYDVPMFLKANGVFTLAIQLFGTIVLYYTAVSNEVRPSNYIAFNSAYGAVMGAFGGLTSVALSIAGIKPVMDMAEPILKTAPETSKDKELVTELRGNIELNNVHFRYKESMPYVVDGMNLKIKSGEYIAIVGKTGCGKSTLVRLLLGFETPEKGAIYYDNKDVTKLDMHTVRRRIGAVTQDGSLFQGDIYSNIVIAAPHLTLDDAWEAAELAGIADDIRDMPMGMNTLIAEGQGGISGGQKQKLMIARAIAPKPKILIFDEATSALDNKTQKKVSEALDGLNCTRIVIAHRLSTIKHCDRILVLDKGRIAEDGTYDELIAKKGLFAELVERQRLDNTMEDENAKHDVQ
jgi:NHLM bacteriocin system ABC transporter ATP-binding protein